MSEQRTQAEELIRTFLAGVDKSTEFTAATQLFGDDGLALDSLEAAELSAMLEDNLGTDPFSSAPTMPETVGDILEFYGANAPA